MCGELRLEADRLLGEGKRRVDLSEYPELAWQLLWTHRDPTLVKEVTGRLEELQDSLRKKRDVVKAADDPCRAAGEVAKATLDASSPSAFIEPPSTKEIPCFSVIEAARSCPAEMCRDLARFALVAEIYRVGLALSEMGAKAPKSGFFSREFEANAADGLIRLAFLDFFNSLDVGQFEVDLKNRTVLSWGARL